MKNRVINKKHWRSGISSHPFVRPSAFGFLIMKTFSKFSFSRSNSMISYSFGNETYSQKLIVWTKYYFVTGRGKEVEEMDSKILTRDFPGGAVVKNPPANSGDTGSSPGPGRSHIPRSN